MNKLIDIYRLVDNVETLIYSVSIEDTISYQGIMDKDKVTVDIVTEDPIYLQEGDYIYQGPVKYKINRDPEDKQKSDKEHSYTINFEAPIYTLIDKYYCSKVNGDTTVTLTGKLRDFLELLIWNINKDNNPLGVDTGWTIGACPETDYMNITLNGVKCRDALDSFATKFGLEYYVNNKTVNYVSHIENETGLVFTQGKGGGLYEIERKNVDDGDLVTRVYAKGGTDNVIPGEGDSEGRLVLPEKYIENFSESKRGVDAIVEFDNIHPTFQGAVGVVSGDYSREFVCSEIDFDISELAIDEDARVNFLTGDLMGKSFEFKWDNAAKKITLIYQEDTLAAIDTTTGARPNIPSTAKYLRGGELFTLTGLKMSGTYKTNAIVKLRQKTTEWLAYYCRKRVKFELEVDYRYIREHNITLHCGDLITINVPLHNISKLIRITSIEKNLYTGKLTCIVSNYLDEKWKDKIETEVANIKSSNTVVNGGIGGASSVTILENNDDREASDLNVLSSLRAFKEIAERAISKTSDDSTSGFITFLAGLCSNALAELKKGATFGTFIDSITNGTGARIDENGHIQAQSAEIRGFLKVIEIIYNRMNALEGDYSFTACGTIDNITVNEDGTYLLSIRKRWDSDFTALQVNNVVYGKYIGTSTYFTSWMKIIAKNIASNELTVVLYTDEQTPEGVNYPPVKGMNITRRGSAHTPVIGDPDYKEALAQQESWFLSSIEGAITFLQGVDKPVLDESNYAMIIGKLKELSIFKDLPINYDQPYLFARGIVVQDLLRIDYKGRPQYSIVDRSTWETDPKDEDNNDASYIKGYNAVTRRYEQHQCYYMSCLWRCVVAQATKGLAPRYNNTEWDCISGDKSFSLSIKSSAGNSFFGDKVVTDLVATAKAGSEDDITSLIDNAFWQWTRDSGDASLADEDTVWAIDKAAELSNGTDRHNIIHITKNDLPANWWIAKKVAFKCTATILDGAEYRTVSRSYTFN